MSSHVTHVKPSFVDKVGFLLGIKTAPIKFNCWYCNQNSYIMPGTRNTKDHWYCSLCDNYNAKDHSGQIRDPTSMELFRFCSKQTVARKVSSYTITPTEFSICEACQNQLNQIQTLLADYIPDESDPDYEYRYKTADQYSAQLQEQFKLCSFCRYTMSEFHKKQKKELSDMKILQLMEDSKRIKISARPHRLTFLKYGVFWAFSNLIPLLCVILVFCIPKESALYHRTVAIEDMSYVYQTCQNISVKNLISVIKSSLGFVFIGIQSLDLPRIQWVFSKDLIFYLNDYIHLHLTKTISNHLIRLAFIISLLSFKSSAWHALLMHSFFEKDETHNWHLYKNTQHLLYFFRFFFVYSITIDDNYMKLFFVLPALLMYYAILIYTYLSVKINTNYDILQTVGQSLLAQPDYDLFEAKTEKVESDEENDDAMSFVYTKSTTFPQITKPTTYCSPTASSFLSTTEDPLDALVNGMNGLKVWRDRKN